MSDGITDAWREIERATSNDAYDRILALHLVHEADIADVHTAAREADRITSRVRWRKTPPEKLADEEIATLGTGDRVAWARLLARLQIQAISTGAPRYTPCIDLVQPMSPFADCILMPFHQGIGFSDGPANFHELLAAITAETPIQAAKGPAIEWEAGHYLIAIPRAALSAIAKGAVVYTDFDQRKRERVELDRLHIENRKLHARAPRSRPPDPQMPLPARR